MDDPLRSHGLPHRAASTLACAAVATLLGAGSYQGYEDVCKRLTRRQRRALHCHYDEATDRYVVPSDSTFLRVLGLIDPAHFEAVVAGWLLEQEIGQLERLAVDGKVLRGTGRGDGKPLALLSAAPPHPHTTVRSVQIAEKSNEIPALIPLLAGLSPEDSGRCGCWRLAAVERVTIDLTLPPKDQVEKTEIAYYAASLTREQASDAALLGIIVGHWDAIENGTHRVREVTFRKDACRIARPKAARNMVTLRNLAIGLCNRLKHRGKTNATSLPSWPRSMRATDGLKHVMR